MLTLGSLIAILMIAWLAGRLFTARLKLTSERVSQNFSRCYPTEIIDEILISYDGYAALVKLKSGREPGLVFQPADRVVCRLLTTEALNIEQKTDRTLTLKFGDFVAPHVNFTGSPDTVQKALDWLNGTDRKEGATNAV